MICVTVFVDSAEDYREIHLSGHAGRGDEPLEGQNLVCAAVSALTLNMANSVEHFTDDRFEAEEEEQAGDFRFRFVSVISEESRLLMNSLVFGLLNIAEAYGEPYINIQFKEVQYDVSDEPSVIRS